MLREIEDSNGDSSTNNKVAIWGLSGAGFAIRSGDEVIYIDPWLVPPDPSRITHRCFPVPFSPQSVQRASAVLSTHEHEDHCNVATLIGLNKGSRAVLIGPSTVIIKATQGGFPDSSTRLVRPGDSLQISSEFRLDVFKAEDPYERSAVMYLIRTPRASIFHSGDSSYFEEFKKIGDAHSVDVALLNYGKQIPTPEKPYYMSAEKLAQAARDLRARIVVPMHWNLWVETREDPNRIESVLGKVSPESVLRVIDGGQKLEL